MAEEPIVVNESPIPAQVESAIRSLLFALGGWAVGKGWLTADLLTALVTIVMLAAPAAWAQWRARSNAKLKATLADLLPNSIARTK